MRMALKPLLSLKRKTPLQSFNSGMASPSVSGRSYRPNRALFDPGYSPKLQPYYKYDGGAWGEVTIPPAINGPRRDHSRMRLLTWNIDVLSGGGDIRMHSALSVLKREVFDCPIDSPIVILLQEMSLSDLRQIQASQWIQDHFYITDISNTNWAHSRYGTTTLVDKRLLIEKVFRIYYDSKFGRDALFVDIAELPSLESVQTTAESSLKPLRIGNTHLESLVATPPLRPAQIAASVRYLQEPQVHAGVLAGDFNAIEDFDRVVHVEHKLTDAYLALDGLEDSDEGFTWGFQCEEELMKKFGPSRMDKVLFCGGVRVDGLKRIGIGAKVMEAEREELKKLTNGLDWITDHYGLLATLTILPGQMEPGRI